MEKKQIITNNHWRPLLYLSDLTDDEQKKATGDYDWMDELELDGWMRYKEMLFHVSDFLRIENNSLFPEQWQGYISMTFFDGYLIELSPCGEYYRIARYIS